MSDKIKVAIVISHPIQYFAPVFRSLALDARIDLCVFFHTRRGVDSYFDAEFGKNIQWNVPLLDGYFHAFLSTTASLGVFHWRIIPILFRFRPAAVIFFGYNSLTNIVGMLIAKLLGSKVLMRGDTRLSRRDIDGNNGNLKVIFKRLLFQVFDGAVSIGELNRRYYSYLGVPDDRIFFAPFCVSTDEFSNSVNTGERSDAGKRFRTSRGIPLGALVVLFAGKLIRQKRPCDLLNAFLIVRHAFPDAILAFAGSGPEEESLVQYSVVRGINAMFLGFINQRELPALYASADVFVLPSEGEAWGLVVNEAMAAGLPVIVSDDVGAAADLVAEKDTGVVYPVGDVAQLATALVGLLSSENLRSRQGRNARVLIGQWTVPVCASAMAEAALYVSGRARP